MGGYYYKKTWKCSLKWTKVTEKLGQDQEKIKTEYRENPQNNFPTIAAAAQPKTKTGNLIQLSKNITL